MRRHKIAVLALLALSAAHAAGCGDAKGPGCVILSGKLDLDASMDGNALKSAKIRLIPVGERLGVAPVELRLSAGGGFECSLVKGLEYRVELLEATLVSASRGSRPLEVDLAPPGFKVRPEALVVGEQAAGTLSLLLTRVAGDGAVRVRVSLSDDEPVSFALLRLTELAASSRLPVVFHLRTGPEGLAEATGLPPGRYRITLLEAGRFRQSFELRPDSSVDHQKDVHLTGKTVGPVQVEFVVKPAAALSVTVDRHVIPESAKVRVSLVRRWPDGILRPLARQLTPEITRREDEGRTQDVVRFDALAPGTYLVRAWVPGWAPARREIRVDSLVETSTELRISERGLDVTLSYRGPTEERTGIQRLNLNRWDDPLAGDVAHARLVSGGETAVSGLRPGSYFAILWDLKLAMAVELQAQSSFSIDLRPPIGLATGGARKVTVAVTRGGADLQGLFVGLMPDTNSPVAHGLWMRFAITRPTAEFDDLPEGKYQVVVLDGVLGTSIGQEVRPVIRSVVVGGEDEKVVIDL